MLFGFIPLILRRLGNRPLLTTLLIFTTALGIAITAGIPVFAGAVSQVIMQEEIDTRRETKGWPVFSVRISAAPTERQPIGVDERSEILGWLQQGLNQHVGLPVRALHTETQSPAYRLAPLPDDPRYTTEHLASVRVVTVESTAAGEDGAGLVTVAGTPYGQEAEPGILNVWVERQLADGLALQPGETYELGQLYSSAGEGLPVHIAGIWAAADPSDDGWYRDPAVQFAGSLLTTPEAYTQWIAPITPQGSSLTFWYFVMDEQRMNLDRAEAYTAGLTAVSREVANRLPGGQMDLDPREDLLRGQARKQALQTVLFGFSVPVIVIMVYFLGSLSATQTRFQAGEIATMVSRGSSRWQLLGIWSLESLLLLAVATPLGLGGSLLLARSMSYAEGFMSFAAREPLRVSLASVSWGPVLGVIGASLAIRLAATWRASRWTVVSHERAAGRRQLILDSMRLFFTAVLCVVTWYAYGQLTARGSLAVAGMDVLDPRNDPLVLLAPTLFIFTVPMLAAELFVWLMVPLGYLADYLRSVSSYLATLNLARSGGLYRGPVYRLVLCLSLGVFYASAARSADVWLVDRLRYEVGSDLTFTVGQQEGSVSLGIFGSGSEGAPAEEPFAVIPMAEYEDLPGVAAAARVGEFEAALAGGGDLPYVRLLTVDRLDFARSAYFREDYARASLGELMNRLAMVPNGVLVPRSIAARLNLGVGDRLRANVLVAGNDRQLFEYTIVGLFEYFPTMSFEGDEIATPVLVTNFSFLEMNTSSLLPHHVWLRLEAGADPDAVLAGARELGVTPRNVVSLPELIDREANRVERTGMFGLLTFCFVAAAALSVADLLVYSTAMLQQRAVRHAVLRALGFRQETLLGSVLMEEAASLVYGLVGGILCGIACARLYVPYFPLSATAGRPVPPFIPLLDWVSTRQIAVVMGVALLAAEAVVMIRMMHTHIFTALRLGNRV